MSGRRKILTPRRIRRSNPQEKSSENTVSSTTPEEQSQDPSVLMPPPASPSSPQIYDGPSTSSGQRGIGSTINPQGNSETISPHTRMFVTPRPGEPVDLSSSSTSLSNTPPTPETPSPSCTPPEIIKPKPIHLTPSRLSGILDFTTTSPVRSLETSPQLTSLANTLQEFGLPQQDIPSASSAFEEIGPGPSTEKLTNGNADPNLVNGSLGNMLIKVIKQLVVDKLDYANGSSMTNGRKDAQTQTPASFLPNPNCVFSTKSVIKDAPVLQWYQMPNALRTPPGSPFHRTPRPVAPFQGDESSPSSSSMPDLTPSPSTFRNANGEYVSPQSSGGRERRCRRRINFGVEDTVQLEQAYTTNPHPSYVERKLLAERLNTAEENVKMWFQHRRREDKRNQQMESSEDE